MTNIVLFFFFITICILVVVDIYTLSNKKKNYILLNLYYL